MISRLCHVPKIPRISLKTSKFLKIRILNLTKNILKKLVNKETEKESQMSIIDPFDNKGIYNTRVISTLSIVIAPEFFFFFFASENDEISDFTDHRRVAEN